MEAKKVLLHFGKSSIFKNGIYDLVVKSLKENNIEFVECGGVKANPVLSKVNEAIKICKNENLDGIIAVGGGSVIDSAKAIAAGSKIEGNIWDAFEGNMRLKESLPIFTVLTLSATGSEMNPYAVITKEDENKKWAFSAGLSSYPKVSIIDPTAQLSLPLNQIVNGAVDAMSHLFELYFDGSDECEVMDEYIEGLIRSVMKNVKKLILNPEDYNSRAELAWAATLALNGTTGTGRNGGDWATHMIEHSLSALYDIAHGAGLAIMFPAWMKYVYKERTDRFSRFAEKIFNINEGNEEEKSLVGINKLQEFYDEIGAPTSLNEINIPKSDISKLTENASMTAPLGKLKKLNTEDIQKIYELAI